MYKWDYRQLITASILHSSIDINHKLQADINDIIE